MFSEDPANLEQIVSTNGVLCLPSNQVAWTHVSTKYSSPTHEKVCQILALDVTIPQINSLFQFMELDFSIIFKTL